MYHRRKRRNNHHYQEKALSPTQEATRLLRSIGGYDQDVKEYFFSLPENELRDIFSLYGREYGKPAEEYAKKTFSDWRSGTVNMSGLVETRLFSLLPPRMPEKKKFELAEKIWKHFSPSSKTYFRVGPSTNIEVICDVIRNKLDKLVTEYEIPENIKSRFSWLSSGDINIEEKILNHVRHAEKALCMAKIRLELPVLQKQMLDNQETTISAKIEIAVHKHMISVCIDKNHDDTIEEGNLWGGFYSNKPENSEMPSGLVILLGVAAGIFLGYWFLG